MVKGSQLSIKIYSSLYMCMWISMSLSSMIWSVSYLFFLSKTPGDKHTCSCCGRRDGGVPSPYNFPWLCERKWLSVSKLQLLGIRSRILSCCMFITKILYVIHCSPLCVIETSRKDHVVQLALSDANSEIGFSCDICRYPFQRSWPDLNEFWLFYLAGSCCGSRDWGVP